MNLMQVEQVTKKFSGLTAVNEVSIDIAQGSITGLIGPNGAGKTTFFNCISGYYPVDTGEIFYQGSNVTNSGAHRMCRMGVARTFQIVKPFGNLTVKENVMVGAYNTTSSRAEATEIAHHALEFVGLTRHENKVAHDITICEQRILEMARALATKPKLLLLDEVMAGLNPTEVESVKEIIQKIRESGVTILMIEHIMAALMSLSDRVVVLNQGALLAEGTPEEVTHNQQVIDSYFGGELEC